MIRSAQVCEDTPKPAGFKAVEHDLTIVSRRPRSPDVQLRVNILFTNGLAFLTKHVLHYLLYFLATSLDSLVVVY